MNQIPLKVLVIDDSAVNRRSLSDMLSDNDDVQVVGKAANGEEALRMIRITEPDVLTLDLEMPRMDGFTLLRIIMSQNPLPVIVVSSYAQKENVFKALDLGAIDFVEKPDMIVPGDHSIREELLRKLRAVRGLRNLHARSPQAPQKKAGLHSRIQRQSKPSKVVLIGASTGGPSALMELFSQIPPSSNLSFLIAQHMPEKFTRTFAERLDRRSAVNVREAESGDLIKPGCALLCPGLRSMEIERNLDGDLRVRVLPPDANERFYPSVDRLMKSAARVSPENSVGVVLTGMANDGALGAKALADAGSPVITESEETSVVYGMPRATLDAVPDAKILRLEEIAGFLNRLER